MRDNFQDALARVIVHEGGFSNHPKDRGGPTMKGVTKSVYDGWRDINTQSRRSVRFITDEELHAIYKRNYWDVIGGDTLPAGIDYCVFDAAVNSGPTRAVKWLQRAAKAKTIDGHPGTATMKSVMLANPSDVINSICDQRMAFLRTLDNWSTFGPGWTRRVRDVRKISLALDAAVAPPQPEALAADATGKAMATNTKVTETPAGDAAVKETTLGGGGLIAFGLAKLEVVSDWVSSLSGMSPATAKLLLEAIAIIGIGALVFYGLFRLINVIGRKRRGEEMEAF